MSALVIWRPEPLTAKLVARAAPARQQWALQARSRCSSKRVAASIAVLGDRVAATHPLAKIIETGADPHTIEPKERVLKMADGRFVTGPVRHPGSPARPFLRPTLPLWPELYRRNARGAFRGI
jgi:hypothetical protein